MIAGRELMLLTSNGVAYITYILRHVDLLVYSLLLQRRTVKQ